MAGTFDFETLNRKGAIWYYEETIGFVGMFNCFILMGLQQGRAGRRLGSFCGTCG